MGIRRLIFLPAAVLLASAAVASAAPAPVITNLGPWAANGSNVAFVGFVGGKDALWLDRFGSTKPVRIGPAACSGQEETDALAPGPDGTWACLERGVGNTEVDYTVDVVSAKGVSKKIATAGGPTSGPADSIPAVFGDGNFLGYLHVTAAGVVQLLQITPSAHARHVADLTGVTSPSAVAIGGGNLAILDNGNVDLFTTAGQPLAAIQAKAASVALTNTSVVVRTKTRQIAVYKLSGKLVWTERQGAKTWSAGMAASGGYAVYLGANKAMHAVTLKTGADRVVARAGTSYFFSGIALTPAGAVVPLTTQQGKNFFVTLRFVPTAAL